MSRDIMIDLETLATTADAQILSIGAVRFDLEAGTVYADVENSFYRAVAIDSQPDRKISADTMAWWMGQSKEAKSVFTDPNSVSLSSALLDLQGFVGYFSEPAAQVWSNGADFDLPILNHAFGQALIKAPWKPYSGRCYRTYKNLPGARAIKMVRHGEHHNALHDAIDQATHLCAIHKALFDGAAA